MLPGIGLTHGELTIVLFVTFAVLSARFWPKLGERIAVRLSPPKGDDKGD
jgi:hypothetical protein